MIAMQPVPPPHSGVANGAQIIANEPDGIGRPDRASTAFAIRHSLIRDAMRQKRTMRILLTNDDGIHAPGLAALERIAAALSDDVWVVAPETRPERAVAFAVAERSAAAARDRGAALRAPRHAERLRHHGGPPHPRRRQARPRPLRRQLRPERRRRRDLFRHHRRRDRGHAARRPVDRAQPGLSLRRRRRALPWETAEAHAPGDHPEADRVRLSRRASSTTSTSPTARRTRSTGVTRHRRRASSPTASTSTSAATAAATAVFLARLPAGARRRVTPGQRRRMRSATGAISVTPLRLDMTAHDLGDPLRHHFARADERPPMASARQPNGRARGSGSPT